ncbi:hypothetical protein EDD86DRAFT_207621 [Gorgonomyces haynaldii]|nr:hypothetical protein EDD86DRAFT_207621 [Gorgonomyces haynaldii]
MPSLKQQHIGLAVLAGALFISTCVMLGGVSSQLQFGGDNNCLLYVENYHKPDPNAGGYVFDAYSPSCLATLNIGGIGLSLMFLAIGVRYYYYHKQVTMSQQLIQLLAICASVWTFISFVIAAVLSAGLNQTCHEFEKSGYSCADVFRSGFSVNSKPGGPKSLAGASSGVGAAWAISIFWGLYCAYEWYAFRTQSQQWWSSL